MASVLSPLTAGERLPDHTQLPDSDGKFVQNFQEHPQSILLTDSIQPVLQQRHPDGQYCIGQDSGIYWRFTEPTERGVVAPDWFYVPNVPPSLGGQVRRSYVRWQELRAPLIVLEFVAGDGTEERDRTPWEGKFWIYEQMIRPAFYGIYEVVPGRIEMYHLVETELVALPANEQGRYPIPPLGVELGIWDGTYQNLRLPWMRWWDAGGQLLLTGHELAERERRQSEQERQRADQEKLRAEQEKQRADQEKQRADQEKQRAERLAEKLRALGQDPEKE